MSNLNLVNRIEDTRWPLPKGYEFNRTDGAWTVTAHDEDYNGYIVKVPYEVFDQAMAKHPKSNPFYTLARLARAELLTLWPELPGL
jgi:hypothetical protein